MRTLNRNKQKVYYSNYLGKTPIYEKDEQGNIRQIEIGGVLTNVESGDYEESYSSPVKKFVNIAFSGGESQAVEFGVDVSSYDAVITTAHGYLSMTETSLLWLESEVGYKDTAKTVVDPASADYNVTKPIPSLNGDRYLLKRIVKNG